MLPRLSTPAASHQPRCDASRPNLKLKQGLLDVDGTPQETLLAAVTAANRKYGGSGPLVSERVLPKL